MSVTYQVNNGAPTTATSITISGAAGSGFLHLPSQSAPPSAGASNTLRFFSDSAGRMSWVDTNSRVSTIDTSSITASRTWSLPNESGAIVTATSSNVLTNKTLLASGNNILDATKINGADITGSPASGDVLSYTGTTWSPLVLSAVSPLSYAGGAFSISVGTTSGTVAAGNDLRFSTPQIVKVKTSGAGAGEFTSITTALASIVDAGPTKRYLLDVNPGIYVEGTITTKPYVTITGSGSNNCIIRPNSNTITSIVMVSNATLQDISLVGLNGGVSDKAISIDGASNFIIHNILMRDYHTLIYICATSSPVTGIIFECVGQGTYTRGFHFDGRAITGTNSLAISVANNIMQGSATLDNGCRAEGPYCVATVSTLQVYNAVNGTGVHIEDGATVNLTNSQISGSNNAVVVANVGSSPTIRMGALTMFNNATYDINILHPGTSGVISGIADLTKVNIDPSADVSLFFTDPVNNGSVIVGDLFYGPFSGSQTTEIGDLITYTAPLGEFTGGGHVTAATGLDIDVTGGSGYIQQGAYPIQTVQKVTWVDSVVTLTASATHYVYVDDGGLDFSLSLPNKFETILLARVRTNASDIEFIDSQLVNSHHPYQQNLEMQRDIMGVMYHSGSIVTANASRELAISSGSYYYLNTHFEPNGSPSPANYYAYFHASGVFTRTSQTVVSNTQYDNMTNLTNLGVGKYTKHALYIVNAGINEQYMLIYGQAQYDTSLEAETAALPTPPAYFEQGVVTIAALIVQQGQTAIQNILDIRPRLGSAVASMSSVTDHGDLTGLGDDDHTQYLLVNGTRAMSGNFDVGTFNILNAGTINGVNIATHAGRHLPNGADPLTTAAPLGSLSSASTNTTGTANSFARSDHSHSIDITGFNLNNLTGTLGVTKGGTGAITLTSGNFLTGNGTSAVITTKVVPAGVVVGTSDTQTLTNKTIIGGSSGNDIAANKILGVTISITAPTADQVLIASSSSSAAWGYITDASINDTVSVSHGGTGVATLTSGTFLTGNGTSALITTKIVPAGDVVGTSDLQTLTNKTITGGAFGNDITANSLLNVAIDVTDPITDQVLIATSDTDAAWGYVTDASISGIVSVPHGGTGVSTLTSGNFLTGNGTSAVITTKVVPAGTVVGTSDTQTLTNKTIVGGSSGNDIAANKILGVTISITAPNVGEVLIASSSSAAAWGTITDASISGIVSVPHGGTGVATLTSGNFLVGAGTSAVTTTKAAPAGTVVGTSDTQTLTNKTIVGGSSGNDIAANKILGVTIGITSPNANEVLKASGAAAAAWGLVTDASLSGTVSVSHGGTGVATLTLGNFLTGNGTSAVVTTKVVPAGTVVGTSDTQTLTNKTIVGGSSGNDIAANKILGVTIGITAPIADQVLIATGTSAAAWGTITDASISGIVSVPHGGTGVATLTSGNFLTGNGTSAVLTTKVVPAGTVVGTSDTQTLTNKTIVGGSSGNDITANKILGVTIGITAPNANEVLVATGAAAASWSAFTDTLISGVVSVSKGGTGVATLTSGNFLVGAGTSAVTTTKAAPAGTVVGTSDTQTLTNKTIVGGSSGNDIAANKILGVTIGITAPNANEVLIASGVAAAAWGLVADVNITGTVSVAHGGTGVATLTSGNFLVGAGTSAVTTTKAAPAGAVVGTSDTQTLTNKTLLSTTNTIDATRLQTVNVSSTAPTNGQHLVYNSGTTQWEPRAASGGALATQRWTIKDIKAVGTNGGSVTANTWTTRTLTTLAGSADTSVTLASNQITFTAGTYFIIASAPSSSAGFHKIRLRNITSSTDIAYGTSSQSPNNVTSISTIMERVTFASTTVVEIQHITTSSQTNTGLGAATGIAGTNEIYTTVAIEKLN